MARCEHGIQNYGDDCRQCHPERFEEKVRAEERARVEEEIADWLEHDTPPSPDFTKGGLWVLADGIRNQEYR